jgi:hypothetical protein
MPISKTCKTCQHRKVKKCALYNEVLKDIDNKPEFCKMTLNQISQKITGFKVVAEDDTKKHETKPVVKTKPKKRPEFLPGGTYKIKPPGEEHAIYVSFAEQDSKPFEIFINCKSPDHAQWITALTRVISAVFRLCIQLNTDVSFIASELKDVFNPKGGHWKKGGVFCPSLVAEIGYCLEDYLNKLNGIQDVKKDFPDSAVLCSKCSTKAAVLMDGCMTCLNCGDSKCG